MYYRLTINSKESPYFPNNKPEKFSYIIPFPLNAIDTINNIYSITLNRVSFVAESKYNDKDVYVYLDAIGNSSSAYSNNTFKLLQIFRAKQSGLAEMVGATCYINKYPFHQITFELKDSENLPIKFKNNVELVISINKIS